MRQGRYRKNYLSREQCLDFAEKFAFFVQALQTRFLSDEISSAEFTAAYVFNGLQVLRPNNWKGSRFGSKLLPAALPVHLQLFSQFGFRGLAFVVWLWRSIFLCSVGT